MPCVTCPIYRPSAQPRQPHRPPVCDGDRRLLTSHLADLPTLHHRLTHPDPPPTANSDGRGHDPLAELLPAGPIPGRISPKVSISRTPPAPTPLDPIDLTLHLRNRPPVHDPHGDQTGHQPVLAILDAWVQDWRDTLWPDHTPPTPTVANYSRWLTDRLHDACDKHPAIDEFAAEIKHVRLVMRRALGETDPPPETDRYVGISCRRCDLRGVLHRRIGDEYVECRNCGVLSTETEIADWAALEAAHHRTRYTPQQLTALLRGHQPA